MNTVINSTFITVIYLALLGVGIVYAILILIGSELHGLHIPGLDLHLGGHDINLGHDINIGPADGGGASTILRSRCHRSRRSRSPVLSPLSAPLA